MQGTEGLNLLSGDEAGYFHALEEMFGTEGWQILKREISRELEALPNEKFWSCKSYEEMVQARLRFVDLNRLMNMEAEVEARKANIISARLAEVSEELEAQYE